ncbi:lysophospholipid acyltransferase 5-like [Bolinopsis microptera]|uniref:lysophospholipid acyltransferase 5-like n=1 Tax=Bolinopsis microptera TaxID=2820187 RepID=UPI00307986EC
MALFEGPVNHAASALGLPSGAIRMISALFVCQILSLIHRAVISKIQDTTKRLVSHLLLGLFIAYYVWDVNCVHHIASVLGMYLLFSALPWSIAAKINFVYQLGYIAVGYYHNNMTEDYAINWTTTMATVTLKMIGLGFDLNDNKKDGAKLPSITKILGHTFFFGTYLVGPMDDFKRFDAFIEGRLFSEENRPDMTLGLKRLALGVFFLVLSVPTTAFFSTQNLFSDQYSELPLALKILYITAWGHFSLFRYIAVWLIAESTCIYMGYSFDGEGKWDGLKNFATTSFHLSLTVQGLIDTWNMRTTAWCGKHIYKRCKFLGNKTLSQLITMIFLAIWHGLHVGYLIFFFQEFLYGLVMEKGASQNTLLQRVSSIIPKPVVTVFRWCFIKFFMSFTFVSFELYYIEKIMYVYRSVYFVCPIIAAVVIASNIVFAEEKSSEKQE